MCVDVINGMADTIADLERKLAEREWITVSDRLPDTPEQVLVTVLWHEPYDNYEVTLGEYWDNGETWGDWKDGEITAWQPLPEPYKGGDTE